MNFPRNTPIGPTYVHSEMERQFNLHWNTTDHSKYDTIYTQLIRSECFRSWKKAWRASRDYHTRECFMCKRREPMTSDGKWYEIKYVDETRRFCSVECHRNYAAGADII